MLPFRETHSRSKLRFHIGKFLNMRLDGLDALVYFLLDNTYEMGFTDTLPVKLLPT